MGLFGFDSWSDAFDGGGAGGSGSEYYVGTHEDYVEAYPDDDTASSHTGNSGGSDTGSGDDQSSSLVSDTAMSDSSGFLGTQFVDFVDMFNGGGSGGQGSNYFSGTFEEYQTPLSG